MDKDFFADHQEQENSSGMLIQKSKLKVSSYLRQELLPALFLQLLTFFVSFSVMNFIGIEEPLNASLAWVISFVVFSLWKIYTISKAVLKINELEYKQDKSGKSRRRLVKVWAYEKFRRSLFSLIISILASAIFIYFAYFQLALFDAIIAELLLVTALIVGNVVLQLISYELSSYIFFGLMTAVVSLLSFSLVDKVILYFSLGENDWNWVISQTVSFVLAVLFAYLTNSRYVFNSSGNFWEELKDFFLSRALSTLVFEYLGIFVFINILSMNRDLSKLLASVLVTLTNYILAKFWVFKSRS